MPDHCYYALFHGAAGTPTLLDVFRGKWLVFAGASNLILTASLFANMDGGAFFGWMKQKMELQSGFIDIIWRGKDGVYAPVYSLNYDWGAPAERQWNGNDDANVLWGEAAMLEYRSKIAKGSTAVPYLPDVTGQDATVRMTLAVGQYWPNTRKTMANVMADGPQGNGWDGAAMVLYSQICNWYLNCAGPNPYCSRADLAGLSWPRLKQKYEQELAEMLDVGLCGGTRWRP